MSGYLVLALVFIGLAVAASIVSTLFSRRRAVAAAVAVTVGVLVILTAVFDNLMIASGLFHYAPELLSGVMIGLAPVEDFAYPLAGALLLPALWALLRSRRSAPTTEADR